MGEEDLKPTHEVLEENHQGRNLQRIRIYLGIKQEVLANELGISQPQVSLIEKQAIIDSDILEHISTILGVSADLIRKFDVEKAIYNINNSTFHKDNQGTVTSTQNINPLDKVVELYERLLQSEREKLELYLNNRNNYKSE